MGIKSNMVITKCKSRENWTKVTNRPYLIKFNMTHLEYGVVSLIRKRVVVSKYAKSKKKSGNTGDIYVFARNF